MAEQVSQAKWREIRASDPLVAVTMTQDTAEQIADLYRQVASLRSDLNEALHLLVGERA